MNAKQIVVAIAVVVTIAAFSVSLGGVVSAQNATDANMTGGGTTQGNATQDNATGIYQEMAGARIPKG